MKDEIRNASQAAEAKANQIKDVLRILFGWQVIQGTGEKIILQNSTVNNYRGIDTILTVKQSTGGIELENNAFTAALCENNNTLSVVKNKSLPLFLSLVQSELKSDLQNYL